MSQVIFIYKPKCHVLQIQVYEASDDLAVMK